MAKPGSALPAIPPGETVYVLIGLWGEPLAAGLSYPKIIEELRKYRPEVANRLRITQVAWVG